MKRLLPVMAVLLLASSGPAAQPALDKAAQQWVEATLKKLTLEQLVGQMIFAPLNSTYLSSDTDQYEALVKLVHESHIGGLIAFGGTEPVPNVMLNNTYGPVILGQPLEVASLFNRLQSISSLPLLTTSDFEWGVAMRIAGATKFPRAMAFGATGDPQLAYEAGKVVGIESRAIGVHVDFGPVADVNNNPRNPVINIRSFGEDPARVGAMVSSWVKGLQDAGMLATLKHFPGHGDTDVDSHLGLPLVAHPRARLDAVELPPFQGGVAAGAAGVMVAHMEMPAIDPEKRPATFSPTVIGGLLREQMRFTGLIYTDSMKMQAITKMASPGEAAVRAVQAGIDVVLDSPDSAVAALALAAAVRDGTIPRAQVERSVRRILEAKARLGLHRARTVNIESAPLSVGGRKHEAIAQTVSDRALTLIKDERAMVPLPTPRNGSVLYLSVLDYPSGWRIAAPSRTMIPELRARWAATEAFEISDRTTPSELDLVRALAAKYDAVVAGIFVRASSGSGRLDLAPQVEQFLKDLARASERRNQPFVSVLFGNPYTAMGIPELPAMLLTYDFSDGAERAAVRSLAGEIPIGGKLPIALPGLYPLGHGLTR
ncbi:MAG: glycoside hydrolase family 3 protein [Vicinamibacterales bacterium]|jgi:beta-N-acetylhexosaminidase